jgi:hypothetical protein
LSFQGFETQWKDEIVGLWPTSIMRSQIGDQSLLGRLE